MKRFILFAIAVCFITIIILFYEHFINPNSGMIHSEEYVPIENAMIINGIHMESENPVVDNDGEQKGDIIVDDDFDTYADRSSKHVPTSDHAKRNNESRVTIEQLRKRDPRWHIVHYRIQKNDNLWFIARKYRINHRYIIDLNNINNPDKLHCGNVIQVPTKNGLYHTVEKGDTLTSIARKYRVTMDSIKDQNILRNHRIVIASKLFIPEAKAHVIPVYRKSTGQNQDKTRDLASARDQAKTRDQDKINEQATMRSKNLGRLSINWPLRGHITSGFGTRRDPFVGKRMFHCGIDISANLGTPVKASMDGKVIFSGWKDGYGKVVVLRHQNGYITVYAHNSENIVGIDEEVPQGKIVAYSGNTGAVTGAHLHFEVRKYLTPLNPLRFFRR